MNNNIYCSRCFTFGHTKYECQSQLPPIEYFLTELDNRVSTILEQNKNFGDSEDEFGPYQKLSEENKLDNIPIDYKLNFIDHNLPNITENDQNFNKLKELGFQLNQIYEKHLKPNEKEFYLRFWSIYKISKIIESVCSNSLCIPQGSSLNGTFLSNSDVDLLVFNIDKDQFENIFNELKKRISDEEGNLNEIIGNLKFYPRKRVSFIGFDDKETGIKYEVIFGSVGGIFCSNRMKNFFKKFEKLNLKMVSMLIKSFISCIDGGKVFSGGFSSTMILQLCQFMALRHKNLFEKVELIDSTLLFIEILDFLSNLSNFNEVVICASSENGQFYNRPDKLKGKPFLIMMDSTEKNSPLMGNISEKTEFISDQSKLFLNSIQKLFLKEKFDVVSVFPGFSIDFHYDESTLNQIYSKNSIEVSFSVMKNKTIFYNKKFIESNKLYLVINKNKSCSPDEVIKFSVDFFKPDSIFEWKFKKDNFENDLTVLKYDKKYAISVDLIHELKTKEEPECMEELNTEEFIAKYPMFDANIVCKHESFIKKIE